MIVTWIQRNQKLYSNGSMLSVRVSESYWILSMGQHQRDHQVPRPRNSIRVCSKLVVYLHRHLQARLLRREMFMLSVRREEMTHVLPMDRKTATSDKQDLTSTEVGLPRLEERMDNLCQRRKQLFLFRLLLQRFGQ
jgi:hypothetical protein